MATAIKVGDRFLQPWEYEVECMISALPYTVSGEKDRVRLSMRMVDWKTDEVTSVCWIRLVDGGTWFNDRGTLPYFGTRPLGGLQGNPNGVFRIA